MKTISVSVPVWEQIAKRGKFGETEDDVLRRVFGLEGAQGEIDAPIRKPERRIQTGRRRRLATDPLSSYIDGGELHVSFASGARKSWKLPAKSDKNALRALRTEATSFVEEHGATLGQVNAVKKTLTDSGYLLNR